MLDVTRPRLTSPAEELGDGDATEEAVGDGLLVGVAGLSLDEGAALLGVDDVPWPPCGLPPRRPLSPGDARFLIKRPRRA